MEEYKKGNSMAFETLYDRHHERIYGYLSKRLYDEQSRKEVFQKIFLKLHRFRENYDQNHLFVKWLYTISRSELLDFLKQKKLDTVPLDQENISLNEKSVEEIDLNEIKSLSDKERKALQLKFYSDTDYREISEALKTSQSNARKLISRGLQKLRYKLLGDQNE